MWGLPFDGQILINNASYMHFSRKKKPNNSKDDSRCRHYYLDHGEVIHLQVFLSGQLLRVLLFSSLHRTAAKHPGVAKMMPENQQKIYFFHLLHMSTTGPGNVKYASNTYEFRTYESLLNYSHPSTCCWARRFHRG